MRAAEAIRGEGESNSALASGSSSSSSSLSSSSDSLLSGHAQRVVTEAGSCVAWAQEAGTAVDVYQISSVLMSYDFVAGA